ncbi:hypothetical protein OC861_005093 [Tilletia horrida]|nr:hypothetical protein OC861_005093 [Tilletia horrida]
MLFSPERRLFIVRIVRFCTILSCLLFFGGVIGQLKADTHLIRTSSIQASGDDVPNDAGSGTSPTSASPPFPHRYLLTLIVSRSFLLVLTLLVLLAHTPLSVKMRTGLSRMRLPVQVGHSWAEVDMTIANLEKRSEALDAALQGDVARMVGTAIVLLFASAQELSRRIDRFLLVTAFILACIGLLNIATAILIYNPASSGPFASKASRPPSIDSLAPHSVLRERPKLPSYLHGLAAPSVFKFRPANAGTSQTKTNVMPLDPAHPPTLPPPAARGYINRIPPPIFKASTTNASPTPPSPQLVESINGRHPLATDEALQLELQQQFSPTAATPVLKPFIQEPQPGESDKDVLIRMWTAQIAEKQHQDRLKEQRRPSLLSIFQTGPGAAQPNPQSPKLGGRMQITAPYLSLRAARARYALKKSMGNTVTPTMSPAALVAMPVRGQQHQQISPVASSAPLPSAAALAGWTVAADPYGSRELEVKEEADPAQNRQQSKISTDAQMRDVPELKTGEVRSAPRFLSMQGSVVHRRSTSISSKKDGSIHDPQYDMALNENSPSGPPLAPSSACSTPFSEVPSKSKGAMDKLRVPSLGTFGRMSARSAKSRPSSLSFSCTNSVHNRRLAWSVSSWNDQDEEEMARSDTTRWSRTSAGYTVRTGVTGLSGSKLGRNGMGSTDANSIYERERQKYLSNVLAAIRGPGTTAQAAAAAAADQDAVSSSSIPPPPPPPPMEEEASPKDLPMRSPGMAASLQAAQEAALKKAKERTKMRSLWLAGGQGTPSKASS